MRTLGLRSLLPLALMMVSALPVAAATITITSLETTGASVTAAPFVLPNGTTPNGTSYSNVMAVAINTPSMSTLALSGDFSCFALNGCSDTFSVFFDASGFGSGFTSSLNLSGIELGFFGGRTVFASGPVGTNPGTNGSLGFADASPNGTFTQFIPITGPISGPIFNETLVFQPVPTAFGAISVPQVNTGNGDFSGVLTFALQAFNGNVSLPAGTTADLFLTPSANNVPEPTTLGILAGAGALLVYLKRMKK